MSCYATLLHMIYICIIIIIISCIDYSDQIIYTCNQIIYIIPSVDVDLAIA